MLLAQCFEPWLYHALLRAHELALLIGFHPHLVTVLR
jgi:hypothetical protein